MIDLTNLAVAKIIEAITSSLREDDFRFSVMTGVDVLWDVYRGTYQGRGVTIALRIDQTRPQPQLVIGMARTGSAEMTPDEVMAAIRADSDS